MGLPATLEQLTGRLDSTKGTGLRRPTSREFAIQPRPVAPAAAITIDLIAWLQPADVPLDVGAADRERIEVLVGAPGEEDAQARLGVFPGDTAVAAEIGRHGGLERRAVGEYGAGAGSGESSHTCTVCRACVRCQRSRSGR